MKVTVPNLFDTLIGRLADEFGLPFTFVKAIVWQESHGRPFAFKPEPPYLWLWDCTTNRPFRRITPVERASEHAPKDFKAIRGSVADDAEWWGQQISFGLLQVMGAVAREHGFRGEFLTELTQPAIGLEYGCKHLASLRVRFGPAWGHVIAAYNAGSPRKRPDGTYDNQTYVDDVMAKWEALNTSQVLASSGPPGST